MIVTVALSADELAALNIASINGEDVGVIRGIRVRACPWMPRHLAATWDKDGRLAIMDLRTRKEERDG